MRYHKSIFNRLTKKQLVHLIESGSEKQALQEFKNMRDKQRQSDKENPAGMESCFECRMIARKLGIE